MPEILFSIMLCLPYSQAMPAVYAHTEILGLWTQELDAGLWTLKTLEARLWTLGIRFWILNVKTLRSTVNPFQTNVLFPFNHLKISKTRGFQRFSDDVESELHLEMN